MNVNQSNPITSTGTPAVEPVAIKQVDTSAIDPQVVSKAILASAPKPVNVVQSVEVSREVVAKAAEQIQSFVQSMGRNLNFSIDNSTGFHVVRVVNPATGELVRQLPSPELLKIAQSMSELKNALVSQKA
jgi:flagellar protein FlaG